MNVFIPNPVALIMLTGVAISTYTFFVFVLLFLSMFDLIIYKKCSFDYDLKPMTVATKCQLNIDKLQIIHTFEHGIARGKHHLIIIFATYLIILL